MTLLTVIIPVYNREDVVMRTLASLDAQSRQDFNVILVDNNSTDGTLQRLLDWQTAHSGRVRVISERRRGACAARQCGLDACDSEWTLFFDSDDEMLPNHIENALTAIEENPDADIIGWDVIIAGADGREQRHSFATVDRQFHSLFHGSMATQRYCARTDLFRRAGGWNPQIRVWNDIEMGARLLKINPRVAKVRKQPTVRVFLQPDSITNIISPKNPDAVEPALRSIASSLADKGELWTGIKRAILYASMPPRQGKELLEAILQTTTDRRHRLLMRAAYIWSRRLPAAARLLRPFI